MIDFEKALNTPFRILRVKRIINIIHLSVMKQFRNESGGDFPGGQRGRFFLSKLGVGDGSSRPMSFISIISFVNNLSVPHILSVPHRETGAGNEPTAVSYPRLFPAG